MTRSTGVAVPRRIAASISTLALGGLFVAACGSDGATGPRQEGRWPAVGDTFQYQLGGLPVDRSVEADVIDVDLFETSVATVDALHDDGRSVICYLSAGSFEDVRPDAGRFPSDTIGQPLIGFEDESWLDIRRVDDLLPIMEDRLDRCREKGFDGVEFDNVDGFVNETGFDLDADDEQVYLEALAAAAHERGLAAGLKNALPLIPELVDTFDFALIEQCVEFDECDRVRPFLDRDKAVFIVEYDTPIETACEVAPEGATVIGKDLDLTAAVETCP
jgi:hypothetical protein